MTKLYFKSELSFSILWIVLYVVGTSVVDRLSEVVGIEKVFSLIFHLLLSAVAVFWMKKNSLFEKYGLVCSKVKASKFLYYIPLLIAVSCNLWFGIKFNLSVHESFMYFFSMILVGFLEELIFRGFLFKAMANNNLKSAVIISSITFGVGHIVNLVNGSAADLLSNICQVCYAVAFGFMFVIIFYRGGSLLPCIIAHGAMNALSVFSNEEVMTNEIKIIVSAVLTLISISYTLILLKTLPDRDMIDEKK